MTRALLLVAHGARDPRAQAQAAALAAMVRAAHPDGPVGLAFLELARPDVPEGLRRLVVAGAEQVAVVPLQFFAAGHVKRELPAHLAAAGAAYPGRRFCLAPPLGLHARLVALLRQRLDAALAARAVAAEETAVLLVGRGTSDPDANGDLAKLARLLAEGSSLLAVEPAFAGVTQPDLRCGLDRLVRLGARRIVLLPLLLFPGVMSERLAAAADEARRRAPRVEVDAAPILGPDPALVPLVLERAAEGEAGWPVGCCDLCPCRGVLTGPARERAGRPAGAGIAGYRPLVQGIDGRPPLTAPAATDGPLPHVHGAGGGAPEPRAAAPGPGAVVPGSPVPPGHAPPPGSAASRGGPYLPVRAHGERRGLLLVYTGDGKGKTTAALGLALRAAGHGQRVRIFQFIKGARPTGEWAALALLPTPIPIEPLGDRFTWEMPGEEANRRLAEAGWAVVAPHLADATLDLLVLDELNVVLAKGLLDTAVVVAALAARPPGLHVVVTGRGAPAALVEAADLVSEVRAVKHPLRSGVRAQPGIEF